jgi:hypothetical protein
LNPTLGFNAKCTSSALTLHRYDSDFNHEPCNKRGHKAHWALLTGKQFLTLFILILMLKKVKKNNFKLSIKNKFLCLG